MRYLHSTESDLFQRAFDVMKQHTANKMFLKGFVDTFEGVEGKLYFFPALMIEVGVMETYVFRLRYRAFKQAEMLSLTHDEAEKHAEALCERFHSWSGTYL